MELKVLTFGVISDIMGAKELFVKDIRTKNDLVNYLNAKYPEIIGTKYVVAVNRTISNQNDALEEHSEIALIPPYSGG